MYPYWPYLLLAGYSVLKSKAISYLPFSAYSRIPRCFSLGSVAPAPRVPAFAPPRSFRQRAPTMHAHAIPDFLSLQLRVVESQSNTVEFMAWRSRRCRRSCGRRCRSLSRKPCVFFVPVAAGAASASGLASSLGLSAWRPWHLWSPLQSSKT